MTRPNLVFDASGYPIPMLRWGTTSNVAIGAASAQSGTFTSCVIRVAPTVDCWVRVGANPTATTSSTLIFAGAPEYVLVPEGQKIAVLQASAAGTLNITEAL